MGNGNSRPKVDYPPGTYGTMYGQVPDEKRIDDLLVILLSNIARQPGNEQLHRTGWIMIFEAMCVTDLGLLRKRNVDVAFRVAYSPEQDLRTLRVKAGRQHVAEAEKQGGGGGDSGAQGSSVADGNHAKAVTSIESSATYKAFLDLHKTYRERTPSARPGTSSSRASESSLKQSRGQRSRQASSSKRSHDQYDDDNDGSVAPVLPLVGIRIPDIMFTVNGPDVTLSATATGHTPSTASTKHTPPRLPRASDPPGSRDSVPLVEDIFNIDTFFAPILRKVKSMAALSRLPPLSEQQRLLASSTEVSTCSLPSSTAGLPPRPAVFEPTSPGDSSRTTCVGLAVGEIKAFSGPWPDIDHPLPPQSFGLLNARLTTGWGQTLMYVAQTNEVTGCWMGMFVCLDRLSRVVVLEPTERVFAIEVAQSHPALRASAEGRSAGIAKFLANIEHDSMAWTLGSTAATATASGQVVDPNPEAVSMLRQFVTALHAIAGGWAYSEPLEAILHPTVKQHGEIPGKMSAWEELYATFDFAPGASRSGDKKGKTKPTVPAVRTSLITATPGSEMMSAAVAARPHLKAAWASRSTAFADGQIIGDEEADQEQLELEKKEQARRDRDERAKKRRRKKPLAMGENIDRMEEGDDQERPPGGGNGRAGPSTGGEGHGYALRGGSSGATSRKDGDGQGGGGGSSGAGRTQAGQTMAAGQPAADAFTVDLAQVPSLSSSPADTTVSSLACVPTAATSQWQRRASGRSELEDEETELSDELLKHEHRKEDWSSNPVPAIFAVDDWTDRSDDSDLDDEHDGVDTEDEDEDEDKDIALLRIQALERAGWKVVLVDRAMMDRLIYQGAGLDAASGGRALHDIAAPQAESCRHLLKSAASSA